MKADKRNLVENTIALAIIQILNYVLPFITMPYLSRVLDVDKLGLIFFAQVFIDCFYRFTIYGFDFSGVRVIAINRDNKDIMNLYFNSIVSVQIIFLLLSFIVMTLLIVLCEKFHSDWFIYYFTFLSVIGNVFTLGWFYQGMERMKFNTILNIVPKSIFTLLIFCFIKQPSDYYLVPLFNSTGALLAGFISLFFVKKIFKIKFYIPSVKDIINAFKYSSQFFLTKVAICVYRQINAFILGLIITTTAVAYYVSADRIFWAVFALYNTFIGALFPYMSKNKDIVFFKKLLKYLIILALGFGIFLIFASKILIVIFFSEKMLPSVNILRIFAISLPFYIFVDTFGFPLLGAFGYVKETNYGYIVGGIYNILGLILLYLLNCITIYSVAILVSSTYIIIFLHRMYYINKYKLLAKQGYDV